MLDETSVTTILARHFPAAGRGEISDAARDLVLFDLLADDRVPVWDDAIADRKAPPPVQVFDSAPRRRES